MFLPQDRTIVIDILYHSSVWTHNWMAKTEIYPSSLDFSFILSIDLEHNNVYERYIQEDYAHVESGHALNDQDLERYGIS